MKKEEIISSGDLELYALNELTPLESLRVEIMLERHQEVRDEYEQIQKAFENIAERSASKPDPKLKSKLIHKITQQESASTGKTISMNPWKWLTAASISLAVMTAVLAITYRSQLNEVSRELITLQEQNRVIADNLTQANQLISTDQKIMETLSDLNTITVPLAGLEISPQSSGIVYWNQTSSEVFLKINELPEPPVNKQYQLWGIVDGKPVSAGVLDVTDSIQVMKLIENASAFAITLEPMGGSESPTLEAMYVIGEVG